MSNEFIKNHKEIKIALIASVLTTFCSFVSIRLDLSYSWMVFGLSFAITFFIVDLDWKNKITYLLIFVNSMLLFSSCLGVKTAYLKKGEVMAAVYDLLGTQDPSVVVVSLPLSDYQFTSQIKRVKNFIKSEQDLLAYKKAISIIESNPNLLSSKSVIKQVSTSEESKEEVKTGN